MFIGIHHITLEKNNAIKIPASLCDVLAGRAVVTQGFDRNVLVLPVGTFQNLFKLVSALNIADPLARGLQRMLLGNATFVDIDADGRINLPDTLKGFAQLNTDAVLVGQGNYLEIWSNSLWQAQENDLQDAEANSMRFVSMNLAGI